MYKKYGEWKIRKLNFNILTDKELGYIIGMANGDGYLYYEPNFRHYTVEFFLNSERDKDVQKFLMKLLIKLNLVVNVYKDKNWLDIYRIFVPQRFIKDGNNSVKVERLHSLKRSRNL